MATSPASFGLSLNQDTASVFLRPMTHSDLAKVLANERAAYSHPWTEGIFRNCLHSGYENWVVDQEGDLCGHAVLSITLDEAHLLNLCVAPGQQRKGLGRQVLDFVIERAQRVGAKSLFLEVRASNEPAVLLYESTGFREVGRRRDYYPAARGREDALVMMLPLADDMMDLC